MNVEMTVQGIGAALMDTTASRAEADYWKEKYDNLVHMMKNAGKGLELILDEVEEPFERVKALRSFAKELKELGASLRKIDSQ